MGQPTQALTALEALTVRITEEAHAASLAAEIAHVPALRRLDLSGCVQTVHEPPVCGFVKQSVSDQPAKL